MNISKHQVESYFFGNPTFIADKILFIKRTSRLDEYKGHLTDVQEFGNVWHGITGLFHGEKMTIIVTGIGPGIVGDAIYALNRPNSICLYTGTCGGIDKDIEIGDYFVANDAICGDGFTLHLGYQPFTKVFGDDELTKAVRLLLTTKTSTVKSGTAFTACSVVCEINNDFWSRINSSCSVIEMACASFYAAARSTSKKAAAYFWASDLPTRGKSFFDILTSNDIQMKQKRYDQTVAFDLELLSAL